VKNKVSRWYTFEFLRRRHMIFGETFHSTFQPKESVWVRERERERVVIVIPQNILIHSLITLEVVYMFSSHLTFQNIYDIYTTLTSHSSAPFLCVQLVVNKMYDLRWLYVKIEEGKCLNSLTHIALLVSTTHHHATLYKLL
jgi:hypothetical protein